MLRIVVVSLVIMVAAILFFGNKMHNAQAHRVDTVSSVEQFMSH